jgi:vacuolar-type H+-ATPase subunit F/Vma7
LLKVVAILREDIAAGFALTGVDVIRVKEPVAVSAREVLRSILDGREYGLVIVDETIVAAADERLRAAIAERNVPLFISIPGDLVWSDVEAVSEDEYVAHLIRRAVGYQLKIQL